MKTKYKFIRFVECGDHHWVCHNNRTNDILGYTEYCKQWRCYTFHPDDLTMFSPDCLADIQHFMEQLMKTNTGGCHSNVNTEGR